MGKLKFNISTQFFINYLILFILLIIILILSFIASIFYIEKNYPLPQDDINMARLYKNIHKYGIKRACKIENISSDSYVELVDENLKVISQYNSNHEIGYTYLQKDFNKLLIDSYNMKEFDYTNEKSKKYSSDFNFYYSNDTSNILLVSIPNENKFPLKNFFAFTLSFFIVSLFIVILLYAKITSNSIVRPIRKLVRGVNKISNGDYDIKINFKSKNEFGHLRDAINQMAQKIQKEINLREKSEQNRKRLILDISHDLKTPLTNIIGYSETLHQSKNLEDDIRNKYLDIIISNSKRANNLIQDLFALSKIESDDNKIELKDYDLCEFIRRILVNYILEFEENEMSYEFDIPEEEIICKINPKYLERALSNIIINSIKYSGKNSTLKLKIRRLYDTSLITIEDNGVGINSNSLKDIFEPFVRGDISRNSKTGGTGLGLAITKAIIEKHGGTISLDDYHEKGCRFIISIPLKQE
ncbi:sensor histidine kinase [Tepidibacter formicigenes]|jgi:signal transduction histidine kinase|uniref:histidine kinase n=1 Tax=Tepidibacter formicigenes DSM 15518 TaxID=1123349 RepID=A0A1M6NIB6_9FIRM|nr:HAMP domain-containing sensor histidine kinase [Tepidibacter formicigenes]SHJ95449.1 Signal transduction histidine kinase [Tepidibacter formicigenes DSM 15518]